MAFYDLSKEERKQKYEAIQDALYKSIQNNDLKEIEPLFDDRDTYIRKAAYLAVGKIYFSEPKILNHILGCLSNLFHNKSERVRQTVIYSCGEIAINNFECVKEFFDKGMVDSHHSVRNAVVGAMKKAGEKNPSELLPYCKANILSPIPETRRLCCHGLELRGREHPQEIIDILKLLQFEKKKRVKDMLIHVLGQISYKKGCLFYVSEQVKSWDNKEIYELYKEEVIEVHGRYEKFSEFTQEFVISYFQNHV